MLNPNSYMVLSGALGFSAADLNANRLGSLTPYQRKKLSSQCSRALVWPAVLILVLAASGFILQAEFIFIIFCGACLVTIMIASWQRFQEDLEGHVEAITGQWAVQTLPLGRYTAVVNGQTFTLSEQIKNAFVERVRYRLYYTPGTHTILSAEII